MLPNLLISFSTAGRNNCWWMSAGLVPPWELQEGTGWGFFLQFGEKGFGHNIIILLWRVAAVSNPVAQTKGFGKSSIHEVLFGCARNARSNNPVYSTWWMWWDKLSSLSNIHQVVHHGSSSTYNGRCTSWKNKQASGLKAFPLFSEWICKIQSLNTLLKW